MTALALHHPLTIADYLALGEGGQRTELQEGNLVLVATPPPHHMIAVGDALVQPDPQVPDGLILIPSVDLDLQLAPPNGPGWSRRPDLVVVRRDAVERVRREGGMLRASEAVLVVEIISLGSRRTDLIIKRAEYADAGIPHYWVADLEAPVSLTACHISGEFGAGEFGYADGGAVTGTFTDDEPFPVRLDLTALG